MKTVRERLRDRPCAPKGLPLWKAGIPKSPLDAAVKATINLDRLDIPQPVPVRNVYYSCGPSAPKVVGNRPRAPKGDWDRIGAEVRAELTNKMMEELLFDDEEGPEHG